MKVGVVVLLVLTVLGVAAGFFVLFGAASGKSFSIGGAYLNHDWVIPIAVLLAIVFGAIYIWTGRRKKA